MLEWLQSDNLMFLIEKVGYIGIFSIVFLETAFFFCFFLPGDSLLIIVGLVAAKSVLNFWVLACGIFILSLLGYIVAYWIGAVIGHKMLSWPDKWGYKKDYLHRSRVFFQEKGLAAVVLGRFVPIARSFVPVVAGMSAMPRTRFMVCNVIGALLWGVGLPAVGVLLASVLPDPTKHLKLMVVVIILLSISPMLVKYIRNYITKHKGNNE